MGITIEEKSFFIFRKLELFYNNTFNTLVRDKELPTVLLTLSTLYPIENYSYFFSAYSLDDNFSPIL